MSFRRPSPWFVGLVAGGVYLIGYVVLTLLGVSQ